MIVRNIQESSRPGVSVVEKCKDFDDATELIVLTNAFGIIMYINPAAERRLKCLAHEVCATGLRRRAEGRQARHGDASSLSLVPTYPDTPPRILRTPSRSMPRLAMPLLILQYICFSRGRA